MNRWKYRLLFRPDDPPQGGEPVTPSAPAAPVTPPPAAPELPQGLATMIAKNDNSALKVAEILHGDNFQLREKNRQLQAQIDGAVILRDADKTAYEQYKALGAPSDIATKLRQGELERVAGKAGYNPTVFADLDRMAGGKLEYEAKTEEVDGAQVERFYVKDTTDANAQPQLLSEFAAAKWAAYLPALQPQAASQGTQQPNGAVVPPAPGLRFPAQHPGGGAPASPNLVDKFVQEQNEKAKAVKNPLLRN